MTKMRKKPMNLETNLQALEAIVNRLEHGDLPLEEALKQFEQGVALTRTCQHALAEAEQKVNILLGDTLTPLNPEAPGEPDATE